MLLWGRTWAWAGYSRRQGRLGLGDELVGRDRLHHVVHGALAQAPDPVRLLALRRHHDDRDGAGLRVVRQCTGSLVTVHAGHDDIHENEVGAHLTRETHALGTVRSGRRPVAVLLE